MAKEIWTTAARQLLYTELLARFGRHGEWANSDYPSAAQKANLWEFYGLLAALVGAKSDDAVHQQVRFATQAKMAVPESMMGTFMRNRIAAVDAGFVSPKQAFAKMSTTTG